MTDKDKSLFGEDFHINRTDSENDECINIKDLGAKGNGVSDDTYYVQKAISIVENKGGGAVLIPSGIFKIGEVKITKPFVTIKGSGTLLDGHILIGGDTLPADLHFVIDGITIKQSSLTTGKHGIELQNARIGAIKNVLFRNCDKAIYVRPIDGIYFQHCAKIDIHNNNFKLANYCLYVDRPATPTQAYQIGDFSFNYNYAHTGINICHIYGLGVDGLVCQGNSFFFAGYTEQNQTKTNNIYIDFGNFISITGNQLFEAGLESIILSKCRNFTISGNRIPWCGQRNPSDAIRIVVGDQNSQKFNVGSITSNQIEYPTRHGVSIEDSCGYITVSGNIIRDAGNGYAYYGATLLTSLNHYSINVDTACEFVYITGNNSPDDNINVLGQNNVSFGNLELGRLLKNTDYVLTLSGTETTAAIGKYDGVQLSQSGATTLQTLTGGFEGKEITVMASNANTTLQYGIGASQFNIKGSANTLIPQYGTISFKFRNSRWNETGRNF